MSHEQLLATLSRLEAAERAACGHESIDVNSVAGQCPPTNLMFLCCPFGMR